MAFKLVITERADEQLDDLLFYLLYQCNSERAARHLLDCISKIYNRIQENPFQFPICKDETLNQAEYREAIIPDMNYIIIYRVFDDIIYIVGVFHELENYNMKIEI